MKEYFTIDERVFFWDRNTPEDVSCALRSLSASFPSLKSVRTGTRLIFQQDSSDGICRVKRRKDGALVIRYRQLNQALRSVGSLLSGILPELEKLTFEKFGIMLDCSRNAVMRPDYLKSFLSRIALLGYNMVMLYTEDTYQIKDEPCWGFMRGAFTPKEIRDLDNFCAGLGMELIPCIQTLGHLAQALQWNALKKYADTESVLLTDDEATLGLIEKMILVWKNNVRSRRIHIGMDEAHDIGRGKYYDLHGDVPHIEIFNRHLTQVMELCRKHGMEPMIWSDMYFRLTSRTGDYYDMEGHFTPEIKKMVPQGVKLVYWDYYHSDKSFYQEWIQRHRELSGTPIMASAVNTAVFFWYHRSRTEKNVSACLKACREEKIPEILFTMWGDDGAYCDYASALAGLLYSAELGFSGRKSRKILNMKLAALADGACYDHIARMGELRDIITCAEVWDDPIMLISWNSLRYCRFPSAQQDPVIQCGKGSGALKKVIRKLEQLSSELKVMPKVGTAGNLELAQSLVDSTLVKARLADGFFKAYRLPHAKAVLKMQELLPLIDDYERLFRRFSELFCQMWLEHNKPMGLETMQIRCAGMIARIQELRRRLREWMAGKVKTIPEWEDHKRVKGAVWPFWYPQSSHSSVIR